MKNKTHVMFVIVLLLSLLSSCDNKINRLELVSRHNVKISTVDSLASLTVGNGSFAFTADITGLQTFPNYYEKGVTLGTMSEWGWHSFPNPAKYSLTDVTTYYKVGSDSVPYYYRSGSDTSKRHVVATNWLRANPHRFHLGLIGFSIIKKDSSLITVNDIENPVQELDLWTGELSSSFFIEGEPVTVRTFCHQDNDLISVQVKSPLLESGQLSVKIQFTYPSKEKFNPGYCSGNEYLHKTELEMLKANKAVLARTLDSTRYFTILQWEGDAVLRQESKHEYCLLPNLKSDELEFSALFSEQKIEDSLAGFIETKANNEQNWEAFWKSGGAADFSGSTDKRAAELERRVVLSQYLTKVNCSGLLPPQETGLTYSSWHGKFHLEMHWWHGMHYLTWSRPEIFERQLNYYFTIYDQAAKVANLQGYKGVRWPKMTDEKGRESPSGIGVFLIWQQAHIIYYTEMLYQLNGCDKAVLEKYKKLVFATADFMSSYARYDTVSNVYILGPSLIPAQECFAPETTINPAFELAYWKWSLQVAIKWKERLGIEPDSNWLDVEQNLAPLPVKDSLYLFTENATDSYLSHKYLTDHPMVLACAGFLPLSNYVNKTIMENTLDEITQKWQWETCWGWDFPLVALNAVTLGKPEKAIEALMMDSPKNTYLLNGHNYQNNRLRLYLPGNGALLTAVAYMCTWHNEDYKNGFDCDGWNVNFENLENLHQNND